MGFERRLSRRVSQTAHFLFFLGFPFFSGKVLIEGYHSDSVALLQAMFSLHALQGLVSETFLTYAENSGRKFCQKFEDFSGNSRRLWLFPGSVRGFPRKTPGKSRENCWKIFPESRNATNSRILGTGKGKPAGNLGSTLPVPLGTKPILGRCHVAGMTCDLHAKWEALPCDLHARMGCSDI